MQAVQARLKLGKCRDFLGKRMRLGMWQASGDLRQIVLEHPDQRASRGSRQLRRLFRQVIEPRYRLGGIADQLAHVLQIACPVGWWGVHRQIMAR